MGVKFYENGRTHYFVTSPTGPTANAVAIPMLCGQQNGWSGIIEAQSCEYCQTITKGEHCANCGAPRRAKVERQFIHDKCGIVRAEIIPTNNQGTL